ncbi:VOC family protein [Paeniglutamicibacter antarcticus]|uniref:VOC family protein n=1 Tax=Arthrobacter terrae TaxID=2935737 RepID=A0A931CJ97_9MICC|nr:VOC family protein [Arthrobacter terrae]MBG0739353.1 VOC family protein [Arthrobacter terrae]
MNILKLSWVGTRTDTHDETAAFFHDVMGLTVKHSGKDFTVLALQDGATVEVFGPTSSFNRHLTHPVVGFLVADLERSLNELHEAGVEIVLPIQRSNEGKWLHFRAPDGFVYELSEDEPISE